MLFLPIAYESHREIGKGYFRFGYAEGMLRGQQQNVDATGEDEVRFLDNVDR